MRFVPVVAPRIVAILVALTLAACGGGEARRFNTVLHLDPRLAGGRSSAEVLAAARELVATFPVNDGVVTGEGEAPWRLVDGAVRRRLEPRGLRIARFNGPEHASEAVGLRHVEPLDANSFNVVELDLLITETTRAALRWRREPAPDAPEYLAITELVPRPGGQTARLVAGGVSGWSGEIHGLRIDPSIDRHQIIDVTEIRFLRQGFAPGFEPLGPEASATATLPGDGGIIVQGLEGVRAWPSDLGVPLYARSVAVPPEALLELDVSAPTLHDESHDRLTFRVERSDGAGGWKKLASIRCEEGEGWVPLLADLTDHAGTTIDLRFVALGAGVEEADGEHNPIRTRALFGAPRVLGLDARAPRPNLVLVTLDTLRADHVLDPKETPELAALARTGLSFEEAWSACNATTPSHGSILTGLHVVEHGAIDNRRALPDEVTTVAERLRAAGYETAAAVSVRHIQAGAGFGQGFDRFYQASPESYEDGANTLNATLLRLEAWSDSGSRPFFLWVHLFDPHTPYLPPEDFRAEYDARRPPPPAAANPPTLPVFAPAEVPGDLGWLDEITSHEHVRHLYRMGVAYTDQLVGELRRGLEEAGFLADTALILTSDHGEGMGEHGVYYGHQGLFPETLRVP